MKMKLTIPGPKKFLTTLTAAALSFSLLAPAAFADGAGAAAPEPKKLDAATAGAFLDEFFQSEAAQPHYVGASVIIVKDGEVIAQKGYGYADASSKTEVDPEETVFRVASVSKTFTAVAAMQLIEQGKLGLKDDIRKHIGGVQFNNPFKTPVTVEHLLTHTTGFEKGDAQGEVVNYDFDTIVEIEDFAKGNMPAVTREPGTSYMYDNMAYLLLGLIVQNVSGMPFEEYMQQNVFSPLGMDNSSYELNKLKDKLAVEYDAANQPMDMYNVNPTVMPEGGMLSTAEDIGKFMIAFLNDGAAGDSRILSADTVGEMSEYRSSIHPLLPNTTYGFEAPFQLPGAGSNDQIITKAGDMIGTSSYMFLIPEQNTGVFLIYNKVGALRSLFYPAFISTFFPQYGAPAELAPYEPDAEQLTKFNGIYSDLRVSAIVSELSSAEGDLIVADAFLGQRALKQVDDNLFVDSLTGQFTAFQMDAQGNAVYMKEPYLNPLGYHKKGAAAAGFADIAGDHPYAKAIHAIQSLGYYENNASARFLPEQAVTRGEYVKHLMLASGVKQPENAAVETVFEDLKGHDSAYYVMIAHTLGLVNGTSATKFEPDRVITRQEAAVIIWRAYQAQYPAELFENIELAEGTAEWAKPAVQMLAVLGIHGPEVIVSEDGTVDYLSRKSLNRQEEAAILYALLLTPTDSIVAAMMQQQAAEASEEAAASQEGEANDSAEADDSAETVESEETAETPEAA